MGELAALAVVTLLLAVGAVRFGILIGSRLSRAVDRDDEEPRDPAA